MSRSLPPYQLALSPVSMVTYFHAHGLLSSISVLKVYALEMIFAKD